MLESHRGLLYRICTIARIVSLVCGKTEEEVLSRVSQHAQGVHKMKGFSQDLYETAGSAIREGYWCMEGGF